MSNPFVSGNPFSGDPPKDPNNNNQKPDPAVPIKPLGESISNTIPSSTNSSLFNFAKEQKNEQMASGGLFSNLTADFEKTLKEMKPSEQKKVQFTEKDPKSTSLNPFAQPSFSFGLTDQKTDQTAQKGSAIFGNFTKPNTLNPNVQPFLPFDTTEKKNNKEKKQEPNQNIIAKNFPFGQPSETNLFPNLNLANSSTIFGGGNLNEESKNCNRFLNLANLTTEGTKNVQEDKLTNKDTHFKETNQPPTQTTSTFTHSIFDNQPNKPPFSETNFMEKPISSIFNQPYNSSVENIKNIPEKTTQPFTIPLYGQKLFEPTPPTKPDFFSTNPLKPDSGKPVTKCDTSNIMKNEKQSKEEEKKQDPLISFFGIPSFQQSDFGTNPSKKQKTQENIAFLPTKNIEKIEKPEEVKFTSFTFQKPPPSENQQKKPLDENISIPYPLLQSLDVAPLRYEHELKRPDKELDMMNDDEIFSKIPQYFEQTKQYLEEMKHFRSTPLLETEEIWLQKHKIKKNKSFFEAFLKKVDALYIDSNDKNNFLEKLEKILEFFENEALSPRSNRNLNFFYAENQEKSIVYNEEVQNNDKLLDELSRIKEEIVKKQKEIEEKKKNVPELEIEKNEVVLKISKEIEEMLDKNKKKEDEIKNIMNDLEEVVQVLNSQEKDLTVLKEKKDTRPLTSMIENIMEEIKMVTNEKLEPVQKKYIFFKLLLERFVKKINNLEKKSEDLNGVIDKYHIALERIKEELIKINEEACQVEEEKLRNHERKKILTLEYESEKVTWNKLYQEKRVLDAKKKINDEKTKEKDEETIKNHEGKIRKKEEQFKEFKIRKTRVENLKKEINSLNLADNTNYESLVKEILSEVKEMKMKVVDMEIRKKEAWGNKKEKNKSFCMAYLFYFVILIIVGLVIFDVWNRLQTS